MKRRVLQILCMALVAIAFLNIVGCNEKNKKYDVTMRIETSEGEYWIFTPDIEEMEVEIQYDGKERSVFMAKYNLPDHPRYSEVWFTPSGEGANIFKEPGGRKLLYTDSEGKQSLTDTMKEKGRYSYKCYANSTSTIWKYRSILLIIHIV